MEFSIEYRFDSQKLRKHCSQSCAAKSSLSKREDIQDPWSKEEVGLLEKWAGKKPLAQIQREWNGIAIKHGWQQRSEDAIHVKFNRLCRKLGRSQVPDSDNLSMQQIARRLDIPINRVQKWKSLGLNVKEFNCDSGGRAHITAIAKSDLRAFATLHPEEFWGIERVQLSKALGDSKLAGHIHATVVQPTSGRTITVIRLDTGDVYRSARNAAATLNIGNPSTVKQNILRNCQRDSPMRNGMDFARLDYPVYWVPMSVRDEFNWLAGSVFYEIYLQLHKLYVYKKTSITIVAGRLAVQITRIAFRKNLKQSQAGEELTPKQVLVEYWQERFLSNINTFAAMNQQQGWSKLLKTAKGVAYSVFSWMRPNLQMKQRDWYLEEFGLWYINYASRYFFRSSYLPQNYKPTTQLEIADFFAAMYSSLFAWVEVKGNRWLLGRVLAMGYINKHLPQGERLLDMSDTGIDEETIGLSREVNTKANKTGEVELLDNLLEFLKSQPVSQAKRDSYEMYIAMKLEDASDSEIASTMGVSVGEVARIAESIKTLAVKWRDSEFDQKIGIQAPSF